MKTHILNTPIRDEDLEKIEIGDIVYLNGALITARDQAHHRLVKLGRTPVRSWFPPKMSKADGR